MVQAGFAEFAFDIIFLGEGETAMGLHTGVGGGPGGVGGQHFGHIRLGAAGLTGFKQISRFFRHQSRRFGRRIGLGDGELHALVLPNRSVKDFAVLGVAGRLFDEPTGVADAFMGDQDALGVHPVEDVAKTFTFLTNQIVSRNFQVIEEDRGGGVVDHGADRSDLQAIANRLADIDQEHR